MPLARNQSSSGDSFDLSLNVGDNAPGCHSSETFIAAHLADAASKRCRRRT